MLCFGSGWPPPLVLLPAPHPGGWGGAALNCSAARWHLCVARPTLSVVQHHCLGMQAVIQSLVKFLGPALLFNVVAYK